MTYTPSTVIWPDPEEVRGEPRFFGQGVPIRWDIVDPFLRSLRKGELPRFAKTTGIGLTALRRRVRLLGVVYPVGRPATRRPAALASISDGGGR